MFAHSEPLSEYFLIFVVNTPSIRVWFVRRLKRSVIEWSVNRQGDYKVGVFQSATFFFRVGFFEVTLGVLITKRHLEKEV